MLSRQRNCPASPWCACFSSYLSQATIAPTPAVQGDLSVRSTACVIIIALFCCHSIVAAEPEVDAPEPPSLAEQPQIPEEVAESIAEWDDCPDCIPSSHSWRVGDFRVVPYGFFWADMVYGSRRTNTGAFTLWVFSN